MLSPHPPTPPPAAEGLAERYVLPAAVVEDLGEQVEEVWVCSISLQDLGLNEGRRNLWMHLKTDTTFPEL